MRDVDLTGGTLRPMQTIARWPIHLDLLNMLAQRRLYRDFLRVARCRIPDPSVQGRHDYPAGIQELQIRGLPLRLAYKEDGSVDPFRQPKKKKPSPLQV